MNSYPALGSRIACVAIWVLVACIACYELVLITLYSRPDAVDRCLHIGLPAGLPTGTVPESVVPVARLSYWPLGLECSFTAGGTTVVTSPDWSATAVGAIGICLTVFGIWIAIRSSVRKQHTT